MAKLQRKSKEPYWAPFGLALQTSVPGWVDPILAPLEPGAVWAYTALKVLDEKDAPAPGSAPDFWKPFLSFVELALEARDLIEVLPGTDEEQLELDAFAGTGVICEITRNRDSFQQLLPFIGPLGLSVAHTEVGIHARVIENWSSRDVEWTSWGSDYEPLGTAATSLLPLTIVARLHGSGPH